MLVSDVLGAKVVDRDGSTVGVVADVRLVQDGPLIEGFGNALRVDGFVVGREGAALRLGYIRGGVRGPWPLRALASLIEGRARVVRWSDVERVGDDYRVQSRRDDLPRLVDVYRRGGR
jgi:hypothetical protein